MIKIGDIVTLTADRPFGIHEEDCSGFKGSVGIITEIAEPEEETYPSFRVTTPDYSKANYWFIEEEFRPATDEEIRKAFLESVLKAFNIEF